MDASDNLHIIDANQKRLEDKLNVSSSIQFHNDIPEETLDVAGEMFIYLNFCPDFNKYYSSNPELHALDRYLLYTKKNLKSIMMFLNRLAILSNDDNEILKKTATAVLNKVPHLKGLGFKKIEELSTSSSPVKMKIEDLLFMEKGLIY